MGRPLNKKYFGNRNIGTTGTTSDDYGVGGEGLLSVATGTGGSGYSQGTTLVVAGPNIPGGATATVSVTISARVANGTGGAITGYTVSDRGSGYTSAPTVTVTKPASVTIAATGSNTGTTLTMASTAGIYAGMTVTGSSGLGTGTAANTVVVGSVDSDTQVTVLTAHDGAVSGSLTFADVGSTASPGARALTTDSGNVGSATNQENAISITAFVPLESSNGWVSGYSGSSAVVGDIVRQSGNGKFIVKTAQGIGRVKLVGYLGSNVTPAAGEATITATDSDGGVYYVTKISDRRCNIIGYTGSQFDTSATGKNVAWTFNGTSGTKVDDNQPYLAAGVNVKINNA